MGTLTKKEIERIRQGSTVGLAGRAAAIPGLPEGIAAPLRYMDRAGRLAASAVGTAASAILSPLNIIPGIRDWVPDVGGVPEGLEEFNRLRQQGDWDAAISAYQDALNAGKGFWGLAEIAGAFIPTGGPALAGAKVISTAPRLAGTLGRLAPAAARPAVTRGAELGLRGVGRTLRAPWEAEEYVGRQAVRGIGAVARGAARAVKPVDAYATTRMPDEPPDDIMAGLYPATEQAARADVDAVEQLKALAPLEDSPSITGWNRQGVYDQLVPYATTVDESLLDEQIKFSTREIRRLKSEATKKPHLGSNEIGIAMHDLASRIAKAEKARRIASLKAPSPTTAPVVRETGAARTEAVIRKELALAERRAKRAEGNIQRTTDPERPETHSLDYPPGDSGFWKTYNRANSDVMRLLKELEELKAAPSPTAAAPDVPVPTTGMQQALPEPSPATDIDDWVAQKSEIYERVREETAAGATERRPRMTESEFQKIYGDDLARERAEAASLRPIPTTAVDATVAGGRFKHFTTPEAKAQLEAGSPFDPTLLPQHGTGDLSIAAKTGKFAGNRLYLSLDDARWSQVGERRTTGQVVEATSENAGTGGARFYDYEKQKWMQPVDEDVVTNLHPVEFDISPNARVLEIDSYEAYGRVRAKYGSLADESDWDEIARDYDAVAIRNRKIVLSQDDPVSRGDKFYRAIGGDQIIVLNPQVAKIVRPTTGRTVAPVVAAPVARTVAIGAAKLPKELVGAKPRYNMGEYSYSPQFESDVDKALFIISQPDKSAMDESYMVWLREQIPNLSDTELRRAGRSVREHIKETLRGKPEGNVVIPTSSTVTDLGVRTLPSTTAAVDAPVPIVSSSVFEPGMSAQETADALSQAAGAPSSRTEVVIDGERGIAGTDVEDVSRVADVDDVVDVDDLDVDAADGAPIDPDVAIGSAADGEAAEILTPLRKFIDTVNLFGREGLGKTLARNRVVRKVIGPLNRAAVATSPIAKALVGRTMQRFEAQQNVVTEMSSLARLGSIENIFGKIKNSRITNDPVRGTNTPNPLADKNLNAIREYPDRYSLTDLQREWVDAANVLEVRRKNYLDKMGININELTYAEGGQYAGRRVVAKKNKETGEIISAYTFGSSGPSRPGSLMPSEQVRVYRDIEDALLDGFEYLPDDEALMLNLQAAYNRVIDEEFIEWLRTTIPDIDIEGVGLEGGGDLAFRKLSKGERVLREMQPKTRRRYGEVALDDISPAFKGVVFTGDRAIEAKEALIKGLQPEFSKALDAVNQVNAVGRFMSLAADFSPFAIQLLFLAGADPKAYGKAIGGFARALFDPQFHANYLAKGRAIKARHHDLILGISGNEITEAAEQGGLLTKGIFRRVGKMWQPFMRAFNTAMDVAGIEMAEALEHMAKIDPNLPATGSNIDLARMADIDDYINEIRGLASSSRLGVSPKVRQIETFALLAPRYNRSIAALLWDALQGAASTGRQGRLRTKLARNALAKSIGGLLFLGAGLTILKYLSETDEEDVDMDEMFTEIRDHLNPASGRFFTWDVLGRSIGPGTKVRSVVKLLGTIYARPSSLLNMDMIEMENPALKFLRGSLAPVPSDAWDVFAGYNYVGEPTRGEGGDLQGWVRSLDRIGLRVLLPDIIPIWTQAVLLEEGSAGSRAAGGVVELFGGRAYPTPRTQRMKELHREDPEAKDIAWEDLSLTKRDEYADRVTEERGDPGYSGPRGKYLEERDKTNEDHLEAIVREVEDRLEGGYGDPDYQPRTARNKLHEARRDRFRRLHGHWDREQKRFVGGVYDKLYPDMEREEPEAGTKEHVLWRYYRIYEDATDEAGKLDFNKLEEYEGQLWGSLSQEEATWLMDSIRLIENDYPPNVKAMVDASRYLGSVKMDIEGEDMGYWDLADHPLVVQDIQRTVPGVSEEEILRFLESNRDLRQDLKMGSDRFRAIAKAHDGIHQFGGILNRLKRVFIARVAREAPGWYETMIRWGYEPYGYERAQASLRHQLQEGGTLTDIPYKERYEASMVRR